jgi:hypothetical protein
METSPHVNERILPSMIKIPLSGGLTPEINCADQLEQYFKFHAFEFPV